MIADELPHLLFSVTGSDKPDESVSFLVDEPAVDDVRPNEAVQFPRREDCIVANGCSEK